MRLGGGWCAWKQEKELKRNLLKGTMYSQHRHAQKDSQGKNLKNTFYQPYIKENDGYITVFLCYRVLSTFIFQEALPFQTPLTLMSRNRAVMEHSLPGASTELVTGPPPAPSSRLATTCLYCLSAWMSLSLACSISAGKQEEKHTINVLTQSSTSPTFNLLTHNKEFTSEKNMIHSKNSVKIYFV